MQIPFQGLFAEITPDLEQRNNVVLVTVLMTLAGVMLGNQYIKTIMVDNGGRVACEETPFTGCAQLLPGMLMLSGATFFVIIIFCYLIKERPASTLSPAEFAPSLAHSFVMAYLNRALRTIIMVEFVEAIGEAFMAAPQIYTYYLTLVLNDKVIEERYGVTRYEIATYMIIAASIGGAVGYQIWFCVVGSIGRFRLTMGLLTALLFVDSSFVFISEGAFYPFLILFAFQGFFSSGLGLTLPNLNMDIIDYQEFLTGQRQEALVEMMKPFFKKLATLPIAIVPAMLIDAFGYAPQQDEQPAGVIWTIKLSVSVIPALFALLGLLIFRNFPIQRDSQKEVLDRALDLHRRGLPAEDPFFDNPSLVPPVEFVSGTGKLSYAGKYVSAENADILQHFFPSELAHVIETEDLQVLQRMPLIRGSICLLLSPIGFFITWFYFPGLSQETSESQSFFCIIGMLLLTVGSLGAWFEISRFRKAKQAVQADISMEDVRIVSSIYQHFIAGDVRDGADEDEDEDDEENEEDSDSEHAPFCM